MKAIWTLIGIGVGAAVLSYVVKQQELTKTKTSEDLLEEVNERLKRIEERTRALETKRTPSRPSA